MSELSSTIDHEVVLVWVVFVGGTVLAFVLGIVIAFLVKHPVWVWLTGMIVALLATGILAWGYYRSLFISPPGGSGIGPMVLVPILVTFLFLTFWLSMGTLAGREFREFLGERQRRLEDANRTAESPS